MEYNHDNDNDFREEEKNGIYYESCVTKFQLKIKYKVVHAISSSEGVKTKTQTKIHSVEYPSQRICFASFKMHPPPHRISIRAMPIKELGVRIVSGCDTGLR